ncbi:unnamed protein product [Paramecium sonneborni]|uniref:Uncharacterized protein n=1 Tax=Paramecium sonneborni TaxID=65129 RepID=A0A8S1K5M5_9CILI|nr:unnamed protein product [Paramecium sonneborni]
MQKLNKTPLNYLQSDGDIYPVPETLEIDIGSQITSPQSTYPSLRKASFQSPYKCKKSQQILEFTDQLFIWNKYLSRKFSKSSSQLN